MSDNNPDDRSSTTPVGDASQEPDDEFELPVFVPDPDFETTALGVATPPAEPEPVFEAETPDYAVTEAQPEPEPATLSGVADAVDIVEQLESQYGQAPPGVADEFGAPPAPSGARSGDDLVFADAARGVAEDEAAEAQAPAEEDELPWYADRGDEQRIPEMPPPRAPLPLYGGRSDDNEEILPHFLIDDGAGAPEAVTSQTELREMVREKRRREAEHRPSVARTLAEIPILLLVAGVIAFLVKTFLAQAYYIPSESMVPQLKVNDRVVVSKLAYKVHDPRRGDIIVFDDPKTVNGTTETNERTGVDKWLRKIGEGVGIVQPSTDEFIKRVIGLPGDTVEAHDGSVYVNNHKLLEPYLPVGVETADFAKVKVARGKLWVMGDNRSGSADSRFFGQIEIDSIVGRAVVKIWPPPRISFL